MSIEKQLQPYITALELETPITYEVHDGPISSAYFPEAETSLIRYHPDVRPEDLEDFNPERPYLASFVHELCHLYLGEKFDVSLAGLTSEGTPQQKRLISTVENILADIWVNDLGYSRFSEVFVPHHENFARQVEAGIQSKDWVKLLPPFVPYTLALNEAQAIRHNILHIDFEKTLHKAGFDTRTVSSRTGHSLIQGGIHPTLLTTFQNKTIDQLYDHLRKQMGETAPRTMRDIGVFREFLTTVPEMTQAGDEAMALHQDMINQLISIGRLPVRALLVDETPRPVWYIEDETTVN